MEISFGAQYVFPMEVVLVLCLNFFVTGMRQATLVFRDSLGIFWFDRYKSLTGALLNLAVSIILAREYGTIGVFGGTFISTMLTSFWVEPWVLYRHSLKAPLRFYFIRYVFYSAVTAVSGFVTDLFCRSVSGGLWRVLLIRLLVCGIVPNLLFLLCYFRMGEFRFLLEKLKTYHKKV